MSTTRRQFIAKSLAGAAGLSFLPEHLFPAVQDAPKRFPISIFSKNLHWLGYTDMAAEVAAMGFDGIDLTVRPGGHVEPAKVSVDLPEACAAIRKAGLQINMITTSIVDVKDPSTEAILKAAGALGIKYYRMGWIKYDEKTSISDNLKRIKTDLTALASLSEKYKIKAQYQNHSGASFGSAVWDLGMTLSEINSPSIGSQYDVLHATVEGANSWPLGFKLVTPYIGTIDIKDFVWTQKDGKAKSQTVPLGTGVIDFRNFFGLVKTAGLDCPLSIHYEYPLGGAENGDKIITIPREEVLNKMKVDLVTLRRLLREAELI